jgi:hypothetical protein
MQQQRYVPGTRSMRWYEWLVGLLLLSLACGIRAAPIYRCIDASGAVAFQDQPCASSQRQSEVAIAPAPAVVPPPQYAVDAPPRQASTHAANRPPRATAHSMAFECRASDGRVFYRLGRCPHSLAGDRGGRGKSPVSVSGQPVAREQACLQMRRAGAIGRRGHEFDEQVSTYDKNLGRDPCA